MAIYVFWQSLPKVYIHDIFLDEDNGKEKLVGEKLLSQEHRRLQKNVQGIIIMLGLQLLLGMAVNLLGAPGEAIGAAKMASTAFLIFHIMIGIGLIVGAIMAIRTSRQFRLPIRRNLRFGAMVVCVTFIFGGLTAMTNNNWWSYLMATGFLGALLLYGKVLSNITYVLKTR